MRKALLGVVMALALAAVCIAASPPASDFGYQAKVSQIDENSGFVMRAVLHDEQPSSQYVQVAAEKRDGDNSTTDGKRSSGSGRDQVSIAPPYRLIL